MGKKTVRDHLDQKATWNCQQISVSSRNSSHNDWPPIALSQIKPWPDFSLDTFEYHYAKLLNYEVDCPSLAKPPTKATKITGEDSVHGLINGTVVFFVANLLEGVKSKLSRDIWLGVGSICSLGNEVSLSNKPDWASAVIVDGMHNPHNCYCPGDTKKAISFHPDQLLDGTTSVIDAPNELLPIRQIIHYALLSQTRYALLATERECVVIRFKSEERRSPSPMQQRNTLSRTAAPRPGALRMSGSSMMSDGFSTMSIGSFHPSDVSEVQMAVFPWDKRRQGLTGIGALFWLLVVSTEETGGRSVDNDYRPLSSVFISESQERDKHGKKRSSKKQYISTLTGNSRGTPPPKGWWMFPAAEPNEGQQSDDEDLYDA
ncbi:hypothetical protein O988_01241 [Pseudogymnoascus sp. VKM F-3808]|nr:hypothetical protein O988_01241 [Pseudogymnoascus sp. VKM F-3808]